MLTTLAADIGTCPVCDQLYFPGEFLAVTREGLAHEECVLSPRLRAIIKH